MKTLFATLLLLASLRFNAMADEFKRVAYDDAGCATNQPHLTESTGDWRCPNPGTTNEALRTCAFG